MEDTSTQIGIKGFSFELQGPRIQKRVLGHVRTAKAQISLRISAV